MYYSLFISLGFVLIGFVAVFPLAKQSDFDLDFPSKSTANYAKYRFMPSLTELTACAWVKITAIGKHYVFSYSTSSRYAAIALGYETGRRILHTSVGHGGWK